jgi:hypothetical protein
MTYCPACGHTLDNSPFCTQCGRRVETATLGEPPSSDTAERPLIRLGEETPTQLSLPVPPRASPSAATPSRSRPPPPPVSDDYRARFPLYADEVPASAPIPEAEERARFPWAVLILAAVTLAVVLGIGAWLFGFPDPGRETSSDAGATTAGKPAQQPDDPVQLAGGSRAEAPVTAPPNLDLGGQRVRYDAANMLDGDPATAWRMPGDGTGRTITFTLPANSVMTEVGLINGYAKLDRDSRARPIDWYLRNRRITAVRWSFDDGTEVTQELEQTRRLQKITIEPTRTTTVRLTLIGVSRPADRNGRNYTPISEVSLIGG